MARGDKRGHGGGHVGPVGYPEHGKILTEEAQYSLALGNEIGAPVLAAAPQLGHNIAMATHGTEMYLPDPRLGFRMTKMSKSKRTRAKVSRRA